MDRLYFLPDVYKRNFFIYVKKNITCPGDEKKFLGSLTENDIKQKTVSNGYFALL